MKNKLKIFIDFVRRHKVWSTIIALVIIGLIFFLFKGDNEKTNDSFVVAEIGVILEEVSVTGNVKPLSDVELAFERGGRVANINVSVGDRVYSGQTLATVSNADLVANLSQAQANLKKVQASLGSAEDKAILDLAQARTSLYNSIKDSYTKSDDALRNKVYSLFDDPLRYNAILSFSADSYLKDNIEEGKTEANESLEAWYRSLSKIDETADLEIQYNLAKTNLSKLKILLDQSALAVNGLESESDYTLQSEIDTWKLNISTARTSINSTIDNLTASFDQFKTAGLSAKISQRNTLAEEAGVEQAEAQVASAEAELVKSIIRSPIDGVVTDIPIKLGEIVPVNQKALSVISYGDYQVESFIPEADISKIKLGNKADTTLDSYGNDVVFETLVIKIDPAATVIDGVPTYKVTLKFVNKDDRIRSGMTANLDILTAEKKDVLTVSARAVYSKDDGRYVKVLGIDNKTIEKKVEVGLRGFDGRVEIISGLEVGEKVSTSL